MDLRRTCFVEDWYLGQGDDTLTRIEWYFAAPGARIFPGPHGFGCLDHWDRLPPAPARPGQQRWVKPVAYSKGANPGYKGDGAHACSPDGLGDSSPQWTAGIPSPPGPPIPTDPAGVPDCCAAVTSGAAHFTGTPLFHPASHRFGFAIDLHQVGPIAIGPGEYPSQAFVGGNNVYIVVSANFTPSSSHQPTLTTSFPLAIDGPYIANSIATWIVGPIGVTPAFVFQFGYTNDPGNHFGYPTPLSWLLYTVFIPSTQTVEIGRKVAIGHGQVAESGAFGPLTGNDQASLAFWIGASTGWAPLLPPFIPYTLTGVQNILLGIGSYGFFFFGQSPDAKDSQQFASPWIAGQIIVGPSGPGSSGSAAFTGTAAFSPAGSGLATGAASFNATASMAPAGAAVASGAASFAAAGTMSPAGSGLASASASFTGTGSMSPAGQLGVLGSASFSAVATFSAASPTPSITNVQHNKNAGINSVAVTLSSTVSGNCLTAVCVANDSGSGPAPSISAPSGSWVSAGTASQGGVGGVNSITEIFFLPNISGGLTSSGTFTTTGDTLFVMCQEWSGLALSSVQDGSAATGTAASTGTTIATGTYSTSHNSDLILAGCGSTAGGSAGTWSTPLHGLSILDQQSVGAVNSATMYLVVSSGFSNTAGATASSSFLRASAVCVGLKSP
jgi:hypothetical protein